MERKITLIVFKNRYNHQFLCDYNKLPTCLCPVSNYNSFVPPGATTISGYHDDPMHAIVPTVEKVVIQQPSFVEKKVHSRGTQTQPLGS